MRHRRAVLFASLALLVLATSGVYLAVSEPPHQACFDPPSRFEESAYWDMTDAELLKHKAAGDWRAYIEIADGHGRMDEAFLRERADQGYEVARLRLADHYFEIEVGRQSLSDVVAGLDFREEPQQSLSRLIDSLREHLGPGRAEAVKLLETAAGGYPAAQYQLGHRLVHGQQVARDPARGILWLERAARGGDTQAASLLTRIYYQGRLVPRDDVKCLFFARLTRNPCIPAALLLLQNRGDRTALPASLRWLDASVLDKWIRRDALVAARLTSCSKPAGLKHEWMSFLLDESYDLYDVHELMVTSLYDLAFSGDDLAFFVSDLPESIESTWPRPFSLWNRFTPLNPGACVAHAQAGDALAQYVLGCSRLVQTASAAVSDTTCPQDDTSPFGRCRAKSPATPVEQAEGVVWLRKSAAQGFHAAMGKLGECLRFGTGVNVDRVESAYWLTLATTDIHTRYAKLRDIALAELAPAARAEVAARVLESRRLTLARVRPELEAKARAGDHEACFALARLITQLTPDHRPDAEALALLDTAAEANDRYALRTLGLYHLTALGGDVARAIGLFDRAARAGDAQSAAILARVYYQGKLVPRDDAKCVKYTRLTQCPALYAVLAATGRCAPSPTFTPVWNAPDGYDSDVLNARMMLNADPAAAFWLEDALDGNLRTGDYDAVCSGNAIIWFDRDPADFLAAPLLAGLFFAVTDAHAEAGACIRDAHAGDMFAQYVLGSDRIASSFAYAAADPGAQALCAEGLDWLKRAANQGCYMACRKLLLYYLSPRGVTPDRVESAYWGTLAHPAESDAQIHAQNKLTPDESIEVRKRVAAYRLAQAAAKPAAKGGEKTGLKTGQTAH